MTNAELLEPEQECIEAREKETAGEEKEEEQSQRKYRVKGLAEAFVDLDLNKLLKKFENMDPNTEQFSLIERNVYGALQDGEKKRKERKKKKSKSPWTYF